MIGIAHLVTLRVTLEQGIFVGAVIQNKQE
jgi:hypothetical protein